MTDSSKKTFQTEEHLDKSFIGNPKTEKQVISKINLPSNVFISDPKKEKQIISALMSSLMQTKFLTQINSQKPSSALEDSQSSNVEQGFMGNQRRK